MKLTLKSCDHRPLVPYGDNGGATCISCYERLVFGPWPGVVRVAPAPGPCDHPTKKPVASQITKHMPHRDALCTTCGQVLRHPDGPGEWTPVLFYGYLIHEEAF